jgi:hypothetical protein
MTTAIEVQTFDDLRKAFAEHRRQAGVRQLELDDIAGLQSGYTGKLECGTKRYGDMSLSCTLGALGLQLVVMRKAVTHENNADISTVSVAGIKKACSENGKKGMRVRWSKPRTPEDRARARHAANVRWKAERERKALAEKREKKYGRPPKAKRVTPSGGIATQKPNDQK